MQFAHIWEQTLVLEEKLLVMRSSVHFICGGLMESLGIVPLFPTLLRYENAQQTSLFEIRL